LRGDIKLTIPWQGRIHRWFFLTVFISNGLITEGTSVVSDINRDNNRAVWFDIPVVNLERATSFYTAVLGVKVEIQSFDNFQFSVIEHHDGNGGCLVPKEEEVSEKGILLYLNVHGRLREAVQLVQDNGGRVLEDVHSIGPHGFRALILDSEGNRLALHSETDA